MRHGFLTVLAVIACSLGAQSRADTVYTADGSKLVGKIDKIAGGKLVITTDIVGKVELDMAKVASIDTEEPVNLQLNSGDTLVGPVDSGPNQANSVVKSGIGDVNVESGKVAYLWRQGADSPEVEKYKPKWAYIFEFGASQTEGNTDTRDVRGRFEVNRKTDDDLLKMFLSADYGEVSDVRNRNEYKGGVMYENLLTERLFWYARVEGEHDEFEGIDFRFTTAAGLGYYWIKEAIQELKSRTGAGYRHETYDTGRTQDDVIADLGLDYRLDVAPWMQFVHSGTWSPSLEDFNDYRLDFDTALLFPLKVEMWKLKLGMKNAYNSRPSGDRDRLDNTYYANILMEIKK